MKRCEIANFYWQTGFDFYCAVMELAQHEAARISFVGSDLTTLAHLKNNVRKDFCNVEVSTFSPPFKKSFSSSDMDDMRNFLVDEKPQFVWVGLTAPKQEKLIMDLMADFPQVGWGAIGAVFDYVAFPERKQPPTLMKKYGMEWVYRLIKNPRKMWRRTFVSLPRFLWVVVHERLNK